MKVFTISQKDESSACAHSTKQTLAFMQSMSAFGS